MILTEPSSHRDAADRSAPPSTMASSLPCAGAGLDFAGLFDCLPSAAFVMDIDRDRILHGNRAALSLSGFSRTQIARTRPGRVFPRGQLQNLVEGAGSGNDLDGVILTRRKSEIPISAKTSLLETPCGTLFVLLASDAAVVRSSPCADEVGRDPLTGLPDRHAFELTCAQRFPHLRASTIGLLYVDLDDLKKINDLYGYAQGDSILVEFSRRLESSCPGALVARYGSDQFVVLYEDLPPGLLDARSEITRRVDRLQTVMRRPFELESRTIAASCSIGLALDPHDATGLHALLGCADMALQQAKRSGRDSSRFFVEDDRRRRDEENEIGATLSEIIRHEAIEQCWLPLFDVRSEACIGIEALVRCGPSLVGMDTGRIVEIAQSRGLLPELGRLNIRRSAGAFRRLVLSGRESAVRHVCMNVSAQELLSPSFIDELIEVAESAALPLARIVVEIAERDLFESVDRLRPALELLHARNVQLAVDGFGSSFSSMYMLRDLPIDMIKIDRSFIWQLEASRRDREIVQAMIHLAHSLGVRVAAVGVETRAQLTALREMGCDVAQGYLLSRPLDLDELSDFLRRHVLRKS